MLIQETSTMRGLMNELGRAWDGLDALSQIISARAGDAAGSPSLDRLLHAACVGRRDLSVAVWKTGEGAPTLVAQHNCAGIDPSARAIAWECSRDAITRISNADGYHDARSPGSGPHVLAAVGVSPSGVRITVAMWAPSVSSRFDSHMARIAEALSLQLALAFEGEGALRRVLAQERDNADLEAARLVQSALLEAPTSGRAGAITWATYSRAARVACGDFQDVVALPSGAVEAVVGDVMGKGLPAALLGAACLNRLLRAKLALGPAARPGSILTEANRTLTPELRRLDSFASVALLRIEPEPLRLVFADAGHGNVAVRCADGTVFQPVGRETFLGVERAAYGEIAMSLHPGDLVLVGTDGFAALAERGRFDFSGWLRDLRCGTPAQALANLRSRIAATLPDDDAPQDDLTCVAIGVSE